MKETISTNQIKPPHRHRRKRERTFVRFGKCIHIYRSITKANPHSIHRTHMYPNINAIHATLPPLNHGKRRRSERKRKTWTDDYDILCAHRVCVCVCGKNSIEWAYSVYICTVHNIHTSRTTSSIDVICVCSAGKQASDVSTSLVNYDSSIPMYRTVHKLDRLKCQCARARVPLYVCTYLAKKQDSLKCESKRTRTNERTRTREPPHRCVELIILSLSMCQ